MSGPAVDGNGTSESAARILPRAIADGGVVGCSCCAPFIEELEEWMVGRGSGKYDELTPRESHEYGYASLPFGSGGRLGNCGAISASAFIESGTLLAEVVRETARKELETRGEPCICVVLVVLLDISKNVAG
jgi:hypothetical protein